jgi:cytochrome P450
MIQPAFHKHKLQLLCDEMVLCAKEAINEWTLKSEKPELNIAAEMMTLTLQIRS